MTTTTTTTTTTMTTTARPSLPDATATAARTRIRLTNRPALVVSALAIAAAVAGASALAVAGAPAPKFTAEQIARGAYLVKATGCSDCHTPMKLGANGPEHDMSRLLSGHPQQLALPPAPALPPGPWMATVSATMTAWSGPWGTSFTANLTPDKETGLGTWTARNFVDTIRTGRHMGSGRALLPPMPFPAYLHFSDQDLVAMFAYLQSLPAVSNRVPQPLPPPVPPTVAAGKQAPRPTAP
jgi:hypothetical protein